MMARLQRQTRLDCLVGLGLLALLALSVVLAHALGHPASTVSGLLIAAAKAGLVALFFMDLARQSNRMRVFAAASLLWIAIIFGLTLSDYVARRPESRAPYGIRPEASEVAPLGQVPAAPGHLPPVERAVSR